MNTGKRPSTGSILNTGGAGELFPVDGGGNYIISPGIVSPIIHCDEIHATTEYIDHTIDQDVTGFVHASGDIVANYGSGEAVSLTQTAVALEELSADAVLRDGSAAMTGDLNLGAHRIVNVSTPVSLGDAANKGYVADLTNNLVPKSGASDMAGTFVNNGTVRSSYLQADSGLQLGSGSSSAVFAAKNSSGGTVVTVSPNLVNEMLVVQGAIRGKGFASSAVVNTDPDTFTVDDAGNVYANAFIQAYGGVATDNQINASGFSGTDVVTNGCASLNTLAGTVATHTSEIAALEADKQDTITTGTTAQYFRGDLSLATFPTLGGMAALSPQNNKTVYLSANSGNDSNDGRTEESAVQGLARALTLAGSSGNQIAVFPGSYSAATISTQNVTISSCNAETGGLCSFGTLTFTHSGSSVRLFGISTAGIVHTGAGSLYMSHCKADAVTSSGAGYFEAEACDLSGSSGTATVTFTGAAAKTICNGSIAGFVVVNNSSAIVVIRDSLRCLPITLTAGTLGVTGTPIYATTESGNAIATTGGIVVLDTTRCLTPSGAAARISIGASGFYSICGSYYDSANSVFAGTRVSSAANFDAISTPVLTVGTSASIPNLTCTNLTVNGTTTTVNTATVIANTVEIETTTGVALSVTASGTGNIMTVVDGDDDTKMVIDNSARLAFDASTASCTIDCGSRTDAIALPQGTTAERPSAAEGMIRWNTDDSVVEVYSGSSWAAVGGGAFAPTISSPSLGQMLYYDGSVWKNGLYVAAPTVSMNDMVATCSTLSSPLGGIVFATARFQAYDSTGTTLIEDSGNVASYTYTFTTLTRGTAYKFRALVNGSFSASSVYGAFTDYTVPSFIPAVAVYLIGTATSPVGVVADAFSWYAGNGNTMTMAQKRAVVDGTGPSSDGLVSQSSTSNTQIMIDYGASHTFTNFSYTTVGSAANGWPSSQSNGGAIYWWTGGSWSLAHSLGTSFSGSASQTVSWTGSLTTRYLSVWPSSSGFTLCQGLRCS